MSGERYNTVPALYLPASSGMMQPSAITGLHSVARTQSAQYAMHWPQSSNIADNMPLPGIILETLVSASYSHHASRLASYVQCGMISGLLADHALCMASSAYAQRCVQPYMLRQQDVRTLGCILSYEYADSGLYDFDSPLLPVLQHHYASSYLASGDSCHPTCGSSYAALLYYHTHAAGQQLVEDYLRWSAAKHRRQSRIAKRRCQRLHQQQPMSPVSDDASRPCPEVFTKAVYPACSSPHDKLAAAASATTAAATPGMTIPESPSQNCTVSVSVAVAGAPMCARHQQTPSMLALLDDADAAAIRRRYDSAEAERLFAMSQRLRPRALVQFEGGGEAIGDDRRTDAFADDHADPPPPEPPPALDIICRGESLPAARCVSSSHLCHDTTLDVDD